MFQLQDFVQNKLWFQTQFSLQKSSLAKESIGLIWGGGRGEWEWEGGCRVNMGRALVNDLDQFVYPPYQILASYNAWNPLKSLLWWWWVVGGGGWWWVVVVVEADFSVKLEPQAEQKVTFRGVQTVNKAEGFPPCKSCNSRTSGEERLSQFFMPLLLY